ncbi:MAG: FHA domain-containing protein [Spirochaetales bacterium]|nr:FHA domain-containing protein [Spirochaetales bacterium]
MKRIPRIVPTILTGFAGGMLAWCGVEIFSSLAPSFPNLQSFSLVLGALVGGALGICIPVSEGLGQHQAQKIKRSLLIGLLLGVFFGALGMILGQWVLGLLMNSPQRRFLLLSTKNWARLPGWMIVGIGIGLSSGVRSRSWRRSIAGIRGGLLGGLIGGFTAEWMGLVFSSFYGRAIGFSLLGIVLSLALYQSEQQGSHGRLRVLIGPLKGQLFSMNQERFRIGSHRLSDLTLPQMTSRMGEIRRNKHNLVFTPEPHSLTQINGKDVTQQVPLRYGDVIKIDQTTLLYEAKR